MDIVNCYYWLVINYDHTIIRCIYLSIGLSIYHDHMIISKLITGSFARVLMVLNTGMYEQTKDIINM